jgi:hypothetical protein
VTGSVTSFRLAPGVWLLGPPAGKGIFFTTLKGLDHEIEFKYFDKNDQF